MMAQADTRPRGIAAMFRPENVLQWLLVFIPLAALAEFLHWGGPAVFICAALAIVPLAGLMGKATEATRPGSAPALAGCSTPPSATRPR